MSRRNVLWLAAYLLLAPDGYAQISNGTYTIHLETVSSSGGPIGGGNPMGVQTIIGLPASGSSTNGLYALLGGMEPHRPAAKPVSVTITVSGTINDPSSTITVNGAVAVISGSTYSADGIRLSLGPNNISVRAIDSCGNSSSKSILVHLDLADAKKSKRFSITVSGTIDDPSASVSINNFPTSITEGRFSAQVPVTTGYNMLTARAIDAIGNISMRSVRVFVPLPTRPPARPTVGTVGDPISHVTTATSMILSGTKIPDTSIWINGAQAVAMNDETTWSVALTLIEGDNDLTILAKDATSTSSTEVKINIIVDNIAPILTFQPEAKTNLTPLVINGIVDDSLTTVIISGISTTRTKRVFEATVPLSLGPNTLRIIAISPNGYRTEETRDVFLGTIPSIQAIRPGDSDKIYVGTPISLQVTATDQENDPLQYRFLIDGVLVVDWDAVPSVAWTPGTSDLGRHTVAVEARDGYGGSSTQEVRVFVVRPPIQHP